VVDPFDGVASGADQLLFDKSHRHMGVAAEADIGFLVDKVVNSVEGVEDIPPVGRGIQCGMDQSASQREFLFIVGIIQPLFILFGDMFSCPQDSFFGVGIESGLLNIPSDGIIVMVAPDTGNDIELPHNGAALGRICIVSDHISERDEICDTQFFAFCQNCIQSLQV
jgi:hypothetical protein